jgi:Sulfatase
MRIIKTHKTIFSLFGFLFLFSFIASCASDERKAELAPNIIFIVTDDMEPWTLSVNNDPNTYTPELDRLTKSGAEFRNFICI